MRFTTKIPFCSVVLPYRTVTTQSRMKRSVRTSRDEVGHQEDSKLRRKLPDVTTKFQARSMNRADGSTPMAEHKMHVQPHHLPSLWSISMLLALENTRHHQGQKVKHGGYLE